MMKITPPARTSSPQTHLFIPIFGSNRASGHSSIPPFKPFSADMAARYATVRTSFAGKIAKYVGKVDAFADVIVSYSRKRGFDDALQACIVAKEASTVHCKRCIVAKEASTMHCKRCIVEKEASTMHCKRCIVENKASMMHCKRCIVENKASTVHCKRCIVANKTSTMHCKRCIVENKASTMQCKRCIVAKGASTMHCKRCIVENKTSTVMLLHCASRKRKSGRVVTTPPLRTFKNLTNYFFSLNISWQAFQS